MGVLSNHGEDMTEQKHGGPVRASGPVSLGTALAAGKAA